MDAGHYNPNYAHGQMVGIPECRAHIGVDSSSFFTEPAHVTRFTNFREQIPGTAVSFNMIAIDGGAFNMGSLRKSHSAIG